MKNWRADRKGGVVLVPPPSRSFNHFRPPLALMYIAGYLERHGCPTQIVDVILTKQIRDRQFRAAKQDLVDAIHTETLRRIQLIEPNIVGITCYTPEFSEVAALARDLRRQDRAMKIVVGGIHPTFYPEDFCYDGSPFDVAVVGEGEHTMLDLTDALNNRRRLDDVNGIAFFCEKSSKVRRTRPRSVDVDLETISYPAYEKIDMDYYTTASPYAVRGLFLRSMYILFSRGCPSVCTFCVSKKLREVSGKKHYVRLREPKVVVAELVYLKTHYLIDSFYFIDDMFTMNKRKVREFCQLLREARLGLLWGCSSRVTTVDIETLCDMKAAGCVQIDFGVERGSDEALASLKKGITVSQVRRVFEACERIGIRTFANMLVNVPGETNADLTNILALLDDINATVVSLNVFTPYPGTEIFDNCATGIGKEHYDLLMVDPGQLTRDHPDLFRFAEHNTDFVGWTREHGRKYNRLTPNIRSHLSASYWSTVLRSGRKMDYVRQVGALAREFANQRFGSR